MSAELAVVTNPDDIAALPAEQRGELITRALVESKQWLAVATKGTDPTPIAHFRAWAATVAEMTRQRGLAEEIQLDALEMVRRADRGIGLATRNGQESGEIRRAHEGSPGPRRPYERTRNGQRETVRPRTQGDAVNDSTKLTTDSCGLGRDQLARQIYPVTDGVTDQEHEAALAVARAEKNLSSANVVRKIQGAKSRPNRHQKAERIRDLAQQGYTSRQMEGVLSTTGETIREIAREHGIDIAGDRVTRNTRQIDPERVIRESINTLTGIEYGLNLLRPEDYDAFSVEQLKDWLKAIEEPARAVRALVREMNNRVRNTR